MKRNRKLSIVAIFVIIAAALLIGSPANAQSKPSTSGNSLTPNVFISISKDYYTGNYVAYASHYVGMVDGPYGTYPDYEPCTPDVCGAIVLNGGKKPMVVLSKLASETIVSGNKGYGSADYSVSYNLPWDGSAIPLTSKFKNAGKPVDTQLQYATISLYKAGDPVPPVYVPCCK